MLKHGVLLLITTQEELNQLAEVVDGVEVDALHIDEPYLVFIDEVLWIVPQAKLDIGHFMEDVRPRSFKPWYRSAKRRMQ